MKFGKVEQPELIDLTMPKDHPDTEVVLLNSKHKSNTNIMEQARFKAILSEGNQR